MPPTDGEEGSAGVQSTEQQLKAQAEGVNVEVTNNTISLQSQTTFADQVPKKKDLLLPRSVTQRLAKSVLPPNTTIQKDALLAIQKAATVFVSYLSSQ
jgi:DNA polymerase epsilon subunit 3